MLNLYVYKRIYPPRAIDIAIAESSFEGRLVRPEASPFGDNTLTPI
jgi:hypothetical protein